MTNYPKELTRIEQEFELLGAIAITATNPAEVALYIQELSSYCEFRAKSIKPSATVSQDRIEVLFSLQQDTDKFRAHVQCFENDSDAIKFICFNLHQHLEWMLYDCYTFQYAQMRVKELETTTGVEELKAIRVKVLEKIRVKAIEQSRAKATLIPFILSNLNCFSGKREEFGWIDSIVSSHEEFGSIDAIVSNHEEMSELLLSFWKRI